MTLIKSKFRIALLEVETSKHFFDRIEQRIYGLSDDLSSNEMRGILHNLNLLKDYTFPSGSFAIRIGRFKPNPESDLYVSVGNDNRGYYQIIDDGVLSDSTGNEIWAVVRDNKVTTVMLRKSIQTKDISHNNDRMDVDNSIYNLSKFINKREKEIQKTKKPKDKGIILNLSGVKWKVDIDKGKIYKKNKPEVMRDLYDFIDKLDKPSQEKILSYVQKYLII